MKARFCGVEEAETRRQRQRSLSSDREVCETSSHRIEDSTKRIMKFKKKSKFNYDRRNNGALSERADTEQL